MIEPIMPYEASEWFQIEIPWDATILYAESVADWSWASHLLVWQLGDKFYVYDDSDTVQEVCQEEALELMLDFEKLLESDY